MLRVETPCRLLCVRVVGPLCKLWRRARLGHADCSRPNVGCLSTLQLPDQGGRGLCLPSSTLMLWQVLFWKKRAEEELQRSGIDYTIVRPGKSPIFDRAHVSCCMACNLSRGIGHLFWIARNSLVQSNEHGRPVSDRLNGIVPSCQHCHMQSAPHTGAGIQCKTFLASCSQATPLHSHAKRL